MRAWLESIAGPEYASALMWTVFALIGLLVLLILIRIVRGLTFGTFVAGGRNRKARLAVMDATAVDSQRRLVLVRRDDVEHLILIGGPSDVVVEQNIRFAMAKRPAGEDTGEAHGNQAASERSMQLPSTQGSAAAPVRQPAPQPQHPRPAPAQPVAQARPAEPRFSTMPPVSNTAPAPVARPVVSPPPVVAAARPPIPAPATAPRAAPPAQPNLDDALLQELEVSLERDQKYTSSAAGKAADRALDEEMSKLLGDISVKR